MEEDGGRRRGCHHPTRGEGTLSPFPWRKKALFMN